MSDEPTPTIEKEQEPKADSAVESQADTKVDSGTDPKADPKVGTPLEGLDDKVIAAADAFVEKEYLGTPKQQRAIARARTRALAVYKNYRNDAWFRAEASVRLSVIINFCFSVYQMINAIRFDSVWFASLGIYSVMVTTTRGVILRYMRPDAQDGREELERYRSCGFLMLMLAIAVSLLGLVVNFAGEHPVYPGSMIYVVAGFTIYMVYSSLANLIIYRKLESPLISASKSVAMSCAMVSLYSLQAAALALYCTGDWLWLRSRLNFISALVICSIILIFALHIIIRASRALSGKEDLSLVAAAAYIEHQQDNQLEMMLYNVETQRQLDYWKHKDKVEWRTRGGARERYDEETRIRLKERENRRKAKKKKTQ